jgi:hypothetical protein
MFRRHAGVFMTVLAALLLASAPAQAIHDGFLDGETHPNVGALIVEIDGQKLVYCSGTLIAPSVFLTAAHCTFVLEQDFGITRVWVTFDSNADPATANLLPGTTSTNPGFAFNNADPGDVAVVVLDNPVDWLTPAALPAEGLLDELSAQNGLKGQPFTAVGYGADDRSVGGGPPQFQIDGVRRFATSSYQALQPALLKFSMNPATGDAGGCWGDSGGPNFLGDSGPIVGLIRGGDGACRAMYYAYRLDTPSARAFLSEFVALP